MTTGTADWSLWSTTARLVLTDPAALAEAVDLVRTELDAVELAASRFRDDSEVSRVNRAGGRHTLTPVLADLVRTALDAAADSDGAVDPTLGHALVAAGYDADLGVVRARTVVPRVVVRRGATWRDVRLDGDVLDLPDGLALDLGATAKARAADRCAALVAERLGVGVLVSLGGDLATAGPAPEGGWRVTVDDSTDEHPDQPRTTVALPGGVAVATSSTLRRTWTTACGPAHHILDPVTLAPAARTWRTVTVAAGSCVRANTLSTAAVVRGAGALGMLRAAGATARLVSEGGHVVRLGGWPAESGPDGTPTPHRTVAPHRTAAPDRTAAPRTTSRRSEETP